MNRTRTILVLVVLTAMAACASKPAVEHYYSMVLAADSAGVSGNNEKAGAHLIVGPVRLPAYLNGRGLAMQVGRNQVKIAKHHFWAEPLDEAISKVLVLEISRLTDNVVADHDAGRWAVVGECRLRLEFDRFHSTSESQVVSSGRYWISSSDASVRQEFYVTRTLSEDGYAHAVEMLRQSLGVLAKQIADTLESNSHCSGGQAQFSG